MPLNPPSRLQLFDIALEVLEREPDQEAGGAAAYEARIALSLLRLIRRELALGDAFLEEEHRRLAALLGTPGDLAALNDALCGQLRRGERDIADPRLLQHLRITTLAKLAIDNPRYSACRRAEARQPRPHCLD
ncbi:MAG: hypothetical protein DYH20_14240 [Gammaproteobacteria bacterium PRO9]|nr:hypothetical protein [Gammaproteobacteria bacterium PRO9]